MGGGGGREGWSRAGGDGVGWEGRECGGGGCGVGVGVGGEGGEWGRRGGSGAGDDGVGWRGGGSGGYCEIGSGEICLQATPGLKMY